MKCIVFRFSVYDPPGTEQGGMRYGSRTGL